MLVDWRESTSETDRRSLWLFIYLKIFIKSTITYLKLSMNFHTDRVDAALFYTIPIRLNELDGTNRRSGFFELSRFHSKLSRNTSTYL